MGLRICSLSSGSSGNCIYVSSDTTTILIDAGISCKKIKEDLGLLNAQCDRLNLLITHTHSDHIGHLKTIAKSFSPVIYSHFMAYNTISDILPGYLKLKEFDGDFYVGDITVSPFRVSHDVPCVGFSFLCGGKKISVVTDAGKLTEPNLRHIDGSDVVYIESNHDENMLLANPRYSSTLKRRILSDSGHLSNTSCANAAVECVKNGAKLIMLGHLSNENNTPELAYETTSNMLKSAGLNAMLYVAKQNQMSKLVEVS